MSPRHGLLLGVVAALVVLSSTALAARRDVPVSGSVLSTTRPVYAHSPGSTRVPRLRMLAADRGSGQGMPSIDPGWLADVSARAGIPEAAMRGYAVASLRISAAQPDCGLGWTTLAGIGYVESLHGTLDGRVLGADGHSEPVVLGPALDGQGDVATIPATAESTAWHGDPQWDHAVGPLQFIPSTWATWASDGDGDGVADPNDLDDAAYAAARYLCASGSATGAGWSRAIFSYNHSDSYVRSVYDAAAAYAARTS